MASIRVENAQRKLRLEGGELQTFSERALHLCLREPSLRHGRGKMPDHVTVILVSDRRIASLHRQFMKISGPTDVITFQHGEIFISVETAERNARRFRTTSAHEIRLYIVHGLLHLRGYEDKTRAQAPAMERVQKRIFRAAMAA